jgi:hypothetical protein
MQFLCKSDIKERNRTVNISGAVCDQKTSKFFVSYMEESITGHVSVNVES